MAVNNWRDIFYYTFDRHPTADEEKEIRRRGLHLDYDEDPTWQEIIYHYANELRMTKILDDVRDVADRIEGNIKEMGMNYWKTRVYIAFFGLIFYILGNGTGYMVGRNGKAYWSSETTGINRILAFLLNFPVGWFFLGFLACFLGIETHETYREFKRIKANPLMEVPNRLYFKLSFMVVLLVIILAIGIFSHRIWDY